MYCRFIQYVRISVFVQSRRVHLSIVNCLLKNKFIVEYARNILFTYLSQHNKLNFHAKNII